MIATREVRFEPLTPDRWEDFVRLFGPRGCGGCWCMWFRQTGKEFEAGRGAKNRDAMCEVVDRGPVPGILAYAGDEPAGWVSLSPRERFPRLDRSRAMKQVDREPVWSIVCFYIGPAHRGAGLMQALIRAAEVLATEQGARVLEAYPHDPAVSPVSVDAAYHGVVPAFAAAGFHEVARRTAGQPVMRKQIG